MYCGHCGKKMNSGDMFCTDCGQPVLTGETEPALEPPESPKPQEFLESPDHGNENAELLTENVRTQEPQEKPQEPSSRWLKGWMIAVAAGIILIIAGYIIVRNLVVHNETSSNEISQNNVIHKSDAPVLERLEIEEVDQQGFPTIKVIVRMNTDADSYSASDITLTEDGVVQKVSKVKVVDDHSIAVSYMTEQFHKNPGSEDQRELTVSLGNQQTNDTYVVPQPSSLRIDDLSYNTDRYPEISVYFSLYDKNNRPVEDLSSTVNMFKVLENAAEQKISQIATMDEANEALTINLVMDNSSSMENILSVVQAQAIQFLDQMTITENDRIGFMSFAGASEIAQSDFTNNTEDMASQVYALDASGECTALYRAIEQAVYNSAYNGRSGSKYVVVFTDGEENCSNDSFENQDFLNPQTVIHTANQFGISIYAVGVAQDDQLKAITQGTNGEYISIGSDIEKLGDFYQSIYKKKKGQYVLKYQSEQGDKKPREAAISFLNGQYQSKSVVTVTPRLIDDPGVARAMENYQMNWSAAMSSGDISYLVPYVTTDSASSTSVYKIVYDQLVSLNDAKNNGSVTSFSAPIYHLMDAKKVSDQLVQLQLSKYFTRTIYKHGEVTSTAYKSTTYTYNVVNHNGAWLVDSTVETKVPETCYKDDTYTQVTACK